MSRLIDAEKLKDYIHSQNGRPVIGMTFGEMIGMFIDEQPTVEAKLVVHGEWKYDWLGVYICSNCYERVTVKEVMGEPAWDWCPACGADMRGGKNEQ